MERLSPLDASFLHMEDDINHMHIGSTAVFEGPAPAFGDLRRHLTAKLDLVPRYRQRVRTVPLELGRPVWVDDPHFNLDYHLRHTALPPPGGTTELRNLISRVMSQQLDRTKPLWELWIVEGLSEGRWAAISKVHHAMVDGVAGTDLMTVVFDTEPVDQPAEGGEWEPAPPPSPAALALDAVREVLTSPYEQFRAVRSLVTRPRRLAHQTLASVRGLSSLARLARPTAESAITGPIGPHRRYVWAEARLEDVKAIRSAAGGTVNDVVLTVITEGFRRLIEAHGEDPSGRTVRSLVPVSVRSQDERGTYNNRVSALFAELPIGIEDPLERLEAVRRQMDGLKSSGQAVAAETLTQLGGFAPPLLLALGLRAATRVATRLERIIVDTVTTNVPGPQQPMYLLGRRLLVAYPYVPLASPVRVGVAIFSYDGRLTFGITSDLDTIERPEVVAEGIEEGIAELLAAVGAR